MEDNKILSGIKDLDLEILSRFEDKELFNFCLSQSKNKYVYKLCNDENFWRRRFLNKYGKIKLGKEIKDIPDIVEEKDPNRSWKNFYLKVTYYIDNYQLNEIILTSDNDNAIDFREELVMREDGIEDFIRFFSNYLGRLALEKFIPDLDKYLEDGTIDIYTGIKNSPVSYELNLKDLGKFMKDYPEFPGKPKISVPATDEQYRDFIVNLGEHLKFPYLQDIFNIERVGDLYSVTTEGSDEELKLNKDQLIKLLEQAVDYTRIEIIEAFNNVLFDVRDYLALMDAEEEEE